MTAREKLRRGLLIVGFALGALLIGYILKQSIFADRLCPDTPGYGYGYSSPICRPDPGYGYGYGPGGGYRNGGVDLGWIGYPSINAASFDDALGRLTKASSLADAKDQLVEASRWIAKADRQAKEQSWQRLVGALTDPTAYANSESTLKIQADYAARAVADAKVFEANSKRVSEAYAKRVKELAFAMPVLTGLNVNGKSVPLASILTVAENTIVNLKVKTTKDDTTPVEFTVTKDGKPFETQSVQSYSASRYGYQPQIYRQGLSGTFAIRARDTAIANQEPTLVLTVTVTGTNPPPPPEPTKPIITTLTPLTAKVGTKIALYGTGFTSKGNDILFNGKGGQGTYDVSIGSDKSLTVTIPQTVGDKCLYPADPNGNVCKTVPTTITTGDYKVTVVNSNGTSDPAPLHVDVPTTTPTPPTKPGTGDKAISGTVFLDTNGNGKQDGGEAGLSGKTVELTGDVTKNVSTDGKGNYAFTQLVAGSYRITHKVPSGYERTTDDSRPINAADFASNKTIVHNFGIRTIKPAGPSISSINPTHASLGSKITLFGSGFGDKQTLNAIRLAGPSAISLLAPGGSSTLTVTLPSKFPSYCRYASWFCIWRVKPLYTPGTYQLTVTNNAGTSNTVSFTIDK